MTKYYTRACNFYYGTNAKFLIKKKLALPLCGNKNIGFDKIEIITRKNKRVLSNIIHINKIKNLSTSSKKKVQKDLKKIVLKRKNFLKNIKPSRSFKEDDEDDGKASSALGSLGLKPKPAI